MQTSCTMPHHTATDYELLGALGWDKQENEGAKYCTSFQSLQFLRQQEIRGFLVALQAKGSPALPTKGISSTGDGHRPCFKKREVSPAGPNTAELCEKSLEFRPARSSASAGKLGFLTQKKHSCPGILDQRDANMLLPAIKHIIRTSPITVFSRLDPSSCFVQTVLTLMASFITCLRKAPKSLTGIKYSWSDCANHPAGSK